MKKSIAVTFLVIVAFGVLSSATVIIQSAEATTTTTS